MELLDEIEQVLGIQCAPVTWPIGMGRTLKGVYHLLEDRVYLYQPRKDGRAGDTEVIEGLDNFRLDDLLGTDAADFRSEVELVRGASHTFDESAYLDGRLTPVFFGSAINNFGVKELLDAFVAHAPAPLTRETRQRAVNPCEDALTGFVFKIQANMDPQHRDRIAFMRICSGRYMPGLKVRHVRLGRDIKISDALTFMAADRVSAKSACAGDIIGLHNHGTINIGDTFTQGEELQFTGIPNFAPELFRRAVLKDPLKSKALQKGLAQLCEEGATQLFRPVVNNELILGAVGPLQFDVVVHRLQDEYGVECLFENINVHTARWVRGQDEAMLGEFRRKMDEHLAIDHAGELVFIARSRINLELTVEKWPDLEFGTTREVA